MSDGFTEHLLSEVNNRLAEAPLFYITNDVERGLGLEKALQNYFLVCIDDNEIINYIENEGGKVFCHEREMQTQNLIFRSSGKLLQHERVVSFLQVHGDNQFYLMSFKPSPQFEAVAGNMPILNNPSSLNQLFEEKISQYKELKSSARFPETIINNLGKLQFDKLSKKLSVPFVIQFNRGHTGNSTIFIETKQQFDALRTKYPNREARIASYIKGEAYTINACVTHRGIAMGGLSYQLTGIPEATPEPAATVGNDWDYPKRLNKKHRNEIMKQTIKIGKKMAKEGFKGLFGVDFVVAGDEVYTIEINARQTMSIPSHTKYQLLMNQTPLLLLAIAEFMQIEFDLDIDAYNNAAMQPFDGAQIFIRSDKKEKTTVISSIKPGVYRLQSDNSAFDWSKSTPQQKEHVLYLDEERDKPLIFQNEGYSIEDIKEGGMLLTAVKKGRIVSYNSEIARMQIKQSLFDEGGNLLPWLRDIIRGLRDYVVVPK